MNDERIRELQRTQPTGELSDLIERWQLNVSEWDANDMTDFIELLITRVGRLTPNGEAEKLRAAASLVSEVLPTLNTAVTTCGACGHQTANDRTETQAHEALARVRNELVDWADVIYLPSEHRRESSAARRVQQRRRHGRQ